MCGDFNFDANEQTDECKRFPENDLDVWKALRPNEKGYTEDTHINLMRLQSTKQHKQVRYDQVHYFASSEPIFVPQSIDLVGTLPFGDLWLSDHFGIVTVLKQKEK